MLWSSILGLAASPEATNRAPRFKIPRPIVPGFPEPRRDPSHVAIGERLFLETRFAQYFFAHGPSNVNATIPAGDPIIAISETTGKELAGPIAGFSINCRSCHLVNEHWAAGRGNRAYADYARRSPMPARSDGQTRTVRNSPAMVNATIPREGAFFLHFDGEFSNNEDLIRATLTGRNLGWLPGEHATAVRHIARVIREDDGEGPLAKDFGGYSYRHVFAGEDPALGDKGKRFRLTEDYRLEVNTASDAEILNAVARLISAYMDSLFFSRDEAAEYDGSPYDAFLETNQIPRKVEWGQSPLYHNRNVLAEAQNLREPIFIEPGTDLRTNLFRFKTLTQEFRFGSQELQGMKIFFTLASFATSSRPIAKGGIGNCAACHLAPDFTDFRFHNTGVAQEEYDALHGAGAFAKLRIPDLEERNANHDLWLPPTARHPRAQGPFLDIPTMNKPGRTDLGLWNVFANPDHPGVQTELRRALHGERRPKPDTEVLPKTIGLFKTPSLRGLAFSDPYLHNGSKDTLEDVIAFYQRMSDLAREGKVRNAAPELSGIFLTRDDIAPLAAFLRALNEDYE